MKRLFGLLLILGALPAMAGDARRGALLWEQRCSVCHAVDAAKVGPPHRGVVGRAAGKVPGFAYSPALKASALTWTAATIDTWLQGPGKLVPGTRMRIVVPDATDRADIIAHLATLK